MVCTTTLKNGTAYAITDTCLTLRMGGEIIESVIGESITYLRIFFFWGVGVFLLKYC